MKKRRKVDFRKSKKLFSRTGSKTHRFNNQKPYLMMRGGIRM